MASDLLTEGTARAGMDYRAAMPKASDSVNLYDWVYTCSMVGITMLETLATRKELNNVKNLAIRRAAAMLALLAMVMIELPSFGQYTSSKGTTTQKRMTTSRPGTYGQATTMRRPTTARRTMARRGVTRCYVTTRRGTRLAYGRRHYRRTAMGRRYGMRRTAISRMRGRCYTYTGRRGTRMAYARRYGARRTAMARRYGARRMAVRRTTAARRCPAVTGTSRAGTSGAGSYRTTK